MLVSTINHGQGHHRGNHRLELVHRVDAAERRNSRHRVIAIAIVVQPPPTTAGIVPTSDAARPDSNAPSRFEAEMKTISTAVTRPHTASGVASADVVERMFIENIQNKTLASGPAGRSPTFRYR